MNVRAEIVELGVLNWVDDTTPATSRDVPGLAIPMPTLPVELTANIGLVVAIKRRLLEAVLVPTTILLNDESPVMLVLLKVIAATATETPETMAMEVKEVINFAIFLENALVFLFIFYYFIILLFVLRFFDFCYCVIKVLI
ncbi:MAG: hypothetical protein HY433_02595 [Candidatus Liptonbacteria bacterium]|nr:hypothetical protein [Candidatus Liptonbacteria bacterium]